MRNNIASNFGLLTQSVTDDGLDGLSCFLDGAQVPQQPTYAILFLLEALGEPAIAVRPQNKETTSKHIRHEFEFTPVGGKEEFGIKAHQPINPPRIAEKMPTRDPPT
jgi:hypothetical protein